MKERIHWIDIAKGILILLLLIHHFRTALESNDIDISFYPFMTAWTILFTTFFMQAFFFRWHSFIFCNWYINSSYSNL